MLTDRIEYILEYIKDNELFTNYNKNIFEILEGNLLKSLHKTIDEQLSRRSAKIMKSRSIPINVLKKIIEKLSKLYFKNPERITENKQNQVLIDWYVQELPVNISMRNANESFNSYKNTSIEIFENEEKKQVNMRTIPSHQFLVWSDDIHNPLKPTGYIKFMGTYKKNDMIRNKYWSYTENEFLSFDSEKEIIYKDMKLNEGVNPYGIIPFSYLTQSYYLIIPERDTDTLRMAVMIPLQLSEISFASMFLANPVIYGVDLDIDELQMSPSQFWDFKSTQEGKEPKIGVINPNLDMDQQVRYVLNLLSMWLESRNIRAGSIANIDGDNFASGIALAIREMDTTQHREMQEKYFNKFEQDFWRRLGTIHNKLAEVGRIENRQRFVDPETMKVEVKYADQKPITDEQTVINNAITLYNSGFISKKKAIKKINPEMTDKEIKKLLKEIDKEEGDIVGSQVAKVQSSDIEGIQPD